MQPQSTVAGITDTRKRYLDQCERSSEEAEIASDNILNGIDSWAAGHSDMITLGGTTEFRNWWYGEISTKNHSGVLWYVGQRTGFVSSVLLGYGAAGNLGRAAWALRAAKGYTVVATVTAIGQSTYRVFNGTATWWDAFSFAPAVGHGLGKVKGIRRAVPNNLENVSGLSGRQLANEFTGSKIKRFKRIMRAQGGYGNFEPIKIVIVNGKKIIIDGHHRARAAGSAGIKNVPVEIVDLPADVARRYFNQAAEAADRLGLYF